MCDDESDARYAVMYSVDSVFTECDLCVRSHKPDTEVTLRKV